LAPEAESTRRRCSLQSGSRPRCGYHCGAGGARTDGAGAPPATAASAAALGGAGGLAASAAATTDGLDGGAIGAAAAATLASAVAAFSFGGTGDGVSAGKAQGLREHGSGPPAAQVRGLLEGCESGVGTTAGLVFGGVAQRSDADLLPQHHQRPVRHAGAAFAGDASDGETSGSTNSHGRGGADERGTAAGGDKHHGSQRQVAFSQAPGVEVEARAQLERGKFVVERKQRDGRCDVELRVIERLAEAIARGYAGAERHTASAAASALLRTAADIMGSVSCADPVVECEVRERSLASEPALRAQVVASLAGDAAGTPRDAGADGGCVAMRNLAQHNFALPKPIQNISYMEARRYQRGGKSRKRRKPIQATMRAAALSMRDSTQQQPACTARPPGAVSAIDEFYVGEHMVDHSTQVEQYDDDPRVSTPPRARMDNLEACACGVKDVSIRKFPTLFDVCEANEAADTSEGAAPIVIDGTTQGTAASSRDDTVSTEQQLHCKHEAADISEDEAPLMIDGTMQGTAASSRDDMVSAEQQLHCENEQHSSGQGSPSRDPFSGGEVPAAAMGSEEEDEAPLLTDGTMQGTAASARDDSASGQQQVHCEHEQLKWQPLTSTFLRGGPSIAVKNRWHELTDTDEECGGDASDTSRCDDTLSELTQQQPYQQQHADEFLGGSEHGELILPAVPREKCSLLLEGVARLDLISTFGVFLRLGRKLANGSGSGQFQKQLASLLDEHEEWLRTHSAAKAKIIRSRLQQFNCDVAPYYVYEKTLGDCSDVAVVGATQESIA